MSVLGWLLVPLIATVGAFLVLGARTRPERPVEAERGMEELDRFRAAMTRPMPTVSPAEAVAAEQRGDSATAA